MCRYNEYCKCWDRELERLGVGYQKGRGVFLRHVCVLPYPGNQARGADPSADVAVLSVQARDGQTEQGARDLRRFLLHDKAYYKKLSAAPASWCPALQEGFCAHLWGTFHPRRVPHFGGLEKQRQKEVTAMVERECPKVQRTNGTTSQLCAKWWCGGREKRCGCDL